MDRYSNRAAPIRHATPATMRTVKHEGSRDRLLPPGTWLRQAIRKLAPHGTARDAKRVPVRQRSCQQVQPSKGKCPDGPGYRKRVLPTGTAQNQ